MTDAANVDTLKAQLADLRIELKYLGDFGMSMGMFTVLKAIEDVEQKIAAAKET